MDLKAFPERKKHRNVSASWLSVRHQKTETGLAQTMWA